MKKFLIILVIIALIILIYYQNRDSLHNYTDSFFVSAGQASSSNDLDRALIEAIMAEDTQKIEELLSTDSSKPSDFLPMLRLMKKISKSEVSMIYISSPQKNDYIVKTRKILRMISSKCW